MNDLPRRFPLFGGVGSNGIESEEVDGGFEEGLVTRGKDLYAVKLVAGEKGGIGDGAF